MRRKEMRQVSAKKQGSVKQSESFWKGQIIEVYKKVFDILKQDPAIWFLFGLIAMFDFMALAVLFLSHSEPFSLILAPLIRTFYSDDFLHYPANFVLLPRIFNHAHLVITTIFGVIVTGLVIKKIEAKYEGGIHKTIFDASRSVMKRYFAILAAWVLSYIIFRLTFTFVLPLFNQNVAVYLAASFLIGLMVQSLLVFLLPVILISEKGLIRGILDGVKFGVRHLPAAALLIAVPMAFLVLLSYLKMLTPLWIQIYPELILVILAFGIIVMTVVDLLITSSATVLYLKARN